MKKQLPPSQWEAFFAVYGKKPFKAVRLNPLKGDIERIKALLPFLGKRVPWEENGYYTDEEKVGASPYHFAGLVYSHEPSAMSAAEDGSACSAAAGVLPSPADAADGSPSRTVRAGFGRTASRRRSARRTTSTDAARRR